MNQPSDVSAIPDQNTDPLDVLFGGANPNPERQGCPAPLILRQLATRALPIDHPGYRHIARCSPCYRQLRALQGQRSVVRSLPRSRVRATTI
jgi:hypothetical protein